jgi:hypothetical protein
MRVTASVKKVYFTDDFGSVYSMDALNGGSLTKHRSGASGSPACGCFYLKHSNGAEYFYYFETDQLGRMGDLTSTHASSIYDTGWQSTKYHGAHKFQDRVYACNGRYIASLYDDGAGGLTINKTALDFESSFRANCVSDDGFYLVAGITTNLSTDNIVHGTTKIVFWDTVSSSWTREWTINDASIYAIENTPQGLFAVTSRGVFAFSFNSPPEQLTPYLGTADVPDPLYPANYAVDTLGAGLAFGGADGAISTFGKVRPDTPNVYMKPFTGFTDAVTMVLTTANTSLAFVGTAGSNLYSVTYSDTPQTSVSGETVYIDLQRWYQVGRIVIEFAEPLASGDSLNIDVQTDVDTAATDWGTASYSSNGAVAVKELYGSKQARHLKLIVNFNGGAVKIKNIDVWGDPIEPPAFV